MTTLYSIIVRYIGNKTRRLDIIHRVIHRRSITGGTAVDPFTGTASVARVLNGWCFQVIDSDLMEFSHVLARAYVEANAPPAFDRLAPTIEPHPPSLDGAS